MHNWLCNLCASDESMIGGLSLLLMASQHTVTSATTSTLLTSRDDTKPAVTASSQDMRQPQYCQVNELHTPHYFGKFGSWHLCKGR